MRLSDFQRGKDEPATATRMAPDAVTEAISAESAPDINSLPLGQAFEQLVDKGGLRALIDIARREDLALTGDASSWLVIPPEMQCRVFIRARQAGFLAGTPLLPRIAQVYDHRLCVNYMLQDAGSIASGEVVAVLTGPLRSLLAAERVMLNFLSHLSGIATTTAMYVVRAAGTKARIYDTRKTVPGMRALSKYAVRCGGGMCHRMGLYDAVILKDNHLAAIPREHLGDVLRKAIQTSRARRKAKFFEVEVDDLEQLEIVLPLDVDIVLCDNMDVEQLKKAVAMRDNLHPEVELEASGGITLDNVRDIAETGVNRISVGAITHSAETVDFGLEIAK